MSSQRLTREQLDEQLDERARKIASRVKALGRGGMSAAAREMGLSLHVIRAACVRAGLIAEAPRRSTARRKSTTAYLEYGEQVRAIVDEIGVSGLRDILGVTPQRASDIARWVSLSPALTEEETIRLARAYAIARAYLLEIEPRDILVFRARAMRLRAKRIDALIQDQI